MALGFLWVAAAARELIQSGEATGFVGMARRTPADPPKLCDPGADNERWICVEEDTPINFSTEAHLTAAVVGIPVLRQCVSDCPTSATDRACPGSLDLGFRNLSSRKSSSHLSDAQHAERT